MSAGRGASVDGSRSDKRGGEKSSAASGGSDNGSDIADENHARCGGRKRIERRDATRLGEEGDATRYAEKRVGRW